MLYGIMWIVGKRSMGRREKEGERKTPRGFAIEDKNLDLPDC